MTNQSRPLRTISTLLLATSGCGMLNGCIVMVVPAATSGLIARNAIHRNGGAASTGPNVATSSTAGSPAGTPSALPATTPANTNGKAEISALVVPGSDTVATSSSGAGAVSTWYDVIRFEAKTALGTPDNLRSDVLLSTNATPCGARPTAVMIDAATIGANDYSYVGSLHTMGYAILLTTHSATLPGGQIERLTKEGIPQPVSGETLFTKFTGGDAYVRTHAIAKYCVVGLVGGQADDFPGSNPPGTPKARSGWFLIAKP